MEQSISIKGSIVFGWERFKESPWKLIGVILVAIGVSIITSLILEELLKGNPGFITLSAVGILNGAIQVFVGMGIVNVAIKAHDSIETLDLKDLWIPSLFWKYLFATLLVGAITLVGFILLVIPGIIAIVALLFATYLVVDRKMGPVEAVKESAKITKGHRWKLLGLVIVLGLLNFLGAIALMIGLLVTVPVSMIAIVHAYRTLARKPISQ